MNNPLSPEEQEILSQNPYIKNVDARSVRFTSEFKELAYRELLTGKTMRQIFLDHDIEPTILGDTRIYSFTNNL